MITAAATAGITVERRELPPIYEPELSFGGILGIDRFDTYAVIRCGEIYAQNLPVRAGAVDHLKVGLCAGTMPDGYTATVRDISGFAKSLAP